MNAGAGAALPQVEVATATTSRGTPRPSLTTMTTTQGWNLGYKMAPTIRVAIRTASAQAEEREDVDSVEEAPEEVAEEDVGTEGSGEAAPGRGRRGANGESRDSLHGCLLPAGGRPHMWHPPTSRPLQGTVQPSVGRACAVKAGRP